LQVPVTLAGRVPVKVNFQGGDIATGDRIGFSPIAGVGMKATTSGMTVGVALEPFIATSSSASTTVGSINVFIDSAYHTPRHQFAIDADGNVAIGTSTDPMYRLKVGGDVAATGFINISASSSKKDIAHLTIEDQDSLMESLRGIELAQYRYDFEASSSPLRIGLIAEEAPSEVLSVDGKGVDLYKLSSLTLAGVQDIDKRLVWIESELSELFASSTEDSGGNTLWERIKELATNFVDGVLTLSGLKTDELCVGDVCVNEATFLKMVEKAGGTAASSGQTSGNPSSPSGTSGSGNTNEGSTATSTPSGDTSTTTGDTGDTDSSTPPQEPSGDTVAPSIIMFGSDPMNLIVGDTYKEEGVSASDNVDGDITASVATSGSVDTGTAGTYKVTYSVTDSSSNTKKATRTVIVVEPPEPEPEPEPQAEVAETESNEPAS
jgi:hypothetical protein